MDRYVPVNIEDEEDNTGTYSIPRETRENLENMSPIEKEQRRQE